MGSILPRTALERVQFLEDRETTWSSNAVALGTSAAAITALTADVSAARSAYDAQQQAFDQSKAATQTWHEAVRAMDNASGDIIKQIKAKAAIDGDAVYTLALLPTPAIPSPVPAPGKPSNFVVTLSEGGALTLKWKCVNPKGSQGTIYQVSRRIDGAGDFVTLGVSGNKHFTDSSLPAGASSVSYKVIATRSTARGPEAIFTVNFGVSGGTMTASVAPRLAA